MNLWWPNRRKLKIALARVIAPKAFWSYSAFNPSEISDESLIEAVLIHGNNPLKNRLFKIYNQNKIKRVWEQRLVIQEPRLHELNKYIASDLFHLNNPELAIQQAYKKYNLYDKFSA